MQCFFVGKDLVVPTRWSLYWYLDVSEPRWQRERVQQCTGELETPQVGNWAVLQKFILHLLQPSTEQAANTHSCCYVLNWRVVFWLSDLPIHSATSATLPKYGARGTRGVVGGACDAVYPRSHLTPGWATYSILHIWLINNVITILTLMTMTLDAAVSYFQNKVKEIHLKLLSTY